MTKLMEDYETLSQMEEMCAVWRARVAELEDAQAACRKRESELGAEKEASPTQRDELLRAAINDIRKVLYTKAKAVAELGARFDRHEHGMPGCVKSGPPLNDLAPPETNDDQA